MTELTTLLGTSYAPYSLLRPIPHVTAPLVIPISDTEQPTDPRSGDLPGREVQLWTSVSTSPRLAHIAARGGVPIKSEPYPGEGPCHGELALHWGDVFREVRVPKPRAEGETEVAYLHLGRDGDMLRIDLDADHDISASQFEAQFRSSLERRLAKLGGWHLEAVQIFGNNRPNTALVVQLYGETQPDKELLRSIPKRRGRRTRSLRWYGHRGSIRRNARSWW